MLKTRSGWWIPTTGKPPDAPTQAPEYDRQVAGSSDPPEVTIIVPTRNEAGNVPILLERLERALAGRAVELLVVDDSDDETPAAVRAAAPRSTLSVRLLHREGEGRTDGLGGAVLVGLRAATAPWVVIMDGDLQHPPEAVPLLLAAENEPIDLVVASRYCAGGASDGLAGAFRRRVSGGATLLTRTIFPRRLRGISDPMSGFFGVRRAALNLGELRPVGFKILLELLVRTPGLRRREVPFVFAERGSGDSKAVLAEAGRFARHLCRLTLSRLGRIGRQGARIGRGGALGRGLGFAAVGTTGIAVNGLLLWLLADPATLHLNYLVGAVIATQVSTTWNFLLVDLLVYRAAKRGTRTGRWLGFLAASNAVQLLRLPALALLVSVLGVHYLVANLLTLALSFLFRFAASERLILTLEHR
jgi:glycosyltransferase involved in cell wall biosynthesis